MAFAAANNVRLCGRFTLLGKLGAGGQGEVWRARDHDQGIEIALKILGTEAARTPGAWAALQREFDIASRLDHPLILRVYRPERDGAVLALPMELAPGGDLRRLRTVSYLEIGPALLEIAEALAYTHERGIVHRDLKPGNVLFDARGHVRLADFGVAGSVLGAAAVPDGLAARAGLSPFSASPEQLRGEPPAITDDIYGLGALAYELLSGYPPYYPRFDLKRATEEPVPPLRPSHQAPDRLIALVMAMLSKRSDQRPASMPEVIEALDATLNDTLAFDEPVELAATELEPAAPTSRAPGPEPEPESGLEPGPVSEPVVPMKAVQVEPPRDQDLRGLWADIKVERMPSPAPRAREHRPRWPWVLIAGLAAAAAVSFLGLPRWSSSLRRLALPHIVEPLERIAAASQRALEPVSRRPAERPSPAQSESPAPAVVTEDEVETERARNEARLAALDARGAGVWGGQAYADAKAREAEGIGADEAGSPAMALQKLAQAERLLATVEQTAPGALAAQISAGEQALEVGNGAAARQALELAQRIDPANSRVAEDLRRARALDGVLPLLVDGLNAEAGHHFRRAVQDYRRTLSLDPKNAKAQAGLQRASAALDSEQYAQAVGAGLDALQDGRLQAAREAFEQAHRLNSRGREAAEGLDRVNTAMRDRELEQLQSRGTALEAQQRWSEALQAYDAALEIDPSLAFAQEGRARVATKAGLLTGSLPDSGAAGPGPVEASPARADKTVRISLLSDNVTDVEIPQIGSLGTFVRREIDLKPGKYTVIGTRAGFKDVRRDVTIEPGKETLTISVVCEEPI